jgi:diadenosine tetraphosphate (Ap4A) HIT family hydrolase
MRGDNCFFCDIQEEEDRQRICENEHFLARYDDAPVSKGHCEIISKDHIVSFFDLSKDQLSSLDDLLRETKDRIQAIFSPDGYNIGMNEGEAAGRSVHHLHIHLIPRYKGDTPAPKGGIRNIFPERADYTSELDKRLPSRRKYLK